jgi:hypothetical protein
VDIYVHFEAEADWEKIVWTFPESGRFREHADANDRPWLPFGSPADFRVGTVLGGSGSAGPFPPYALPAWAEVEVEVTLSDGRVIEHSERLLITEEPVSVDVEVNPSTADLGEGVSVRHCVRGSAAAVRLVRSDSGATIWSTGSVLQSPTWTASPSASMCPSIGFRVLPFSESDGIWIPVDVPSLPADVQFMLEADRFDGSTSSDVATLTVGGATNDFDLDGTWVSSRGNDPSLTYHIAVYSYPGDPFEAGWSVEEYPRESGSITYSYGRLRASWFWMSGPGLDPPPPWASGSTSGDVVAFDSTGRPTRILWDNGVTFWRVG